jgi:hypothetical protein
MTVDSGATSTTIPEQRMDMLPVITNHSPDQKIWIANDKGLDIVKMLCRQDGRDDGWLQARSRAWD